MGRTIPSYRIALSEEYLTWKPFRNALGKKYRKLFDDMLLIPRFYISACSCAVKPIRLHPAFMSIILHHFKFLFEAEKTLGMKPDEPVMDQVPKDSLLAKEIRSWNGYRDVLRKEDREHFEMMLSGLGSYVEATIANENLRSAESLFMALIFEQQKMIERIHRELQSR